MGGQSKDLEEKKRAHCVLTNGAQTLFGIKLGYEKGADVI